MTLDAKKKLHVAPCDRNAAKMAVMNWHYSKKMPSGRLAMYGVWELGRYVGSIIYGHGGTPNINTPYGVTKHEICELVRVAFRAHKTPVSRIIKITLLMIKKSMPGIRLIVSYADSAHGHTGGIYKAGNWLYVGDTVAPHVIINGVMMHPRVANRKYGTWSIPWLRKHVDPNVRMSEKFAKHKFLMPMDAAMALQLESFRLPYPKRATSIDNDAATFQAAEGGANPTVALQSIGRGSAEATDAK